MFVRMIKQGILENMRGQPYLPIIVTDDVTHFLKVKWLWINLVRRRRTSREDQWEVFLVHKEKERREEVWFCPTSNLNRNFFFFEHYLNRNYKYYSRWVWKVKGETMTTNLVLLFLDNTIRFLMPPFKFFTF